MKIFLLLTFLTYTNSFSKVDPPNYNFSIETLLLFLPGKPFPVKNNLVKETKLYGKKGKNEIYRLYIEHIRYRFPLFVQVQNNIIIDMYASLPRYFLHNIFHQSLINKLGKQTRYFKVEEQAIYIWKKPEYQVVFAGACTITCFPLYISAYYSDLKKYKLSPLLNELGLL